MDEGIIYVRNGETTIFHDEVQKLIYYNMQRGSEDKVLNKKYTQYSKMLTWT